MLARRTRNGATGLPALANLRDEMDRFFDRFWETKLTPFSFGSEMTGDWLPALNVTEEGDQIVVEAEVPGVDPKDIEVTVHEDMLTIKGKKEETTEQKEKSFFHSERRFGSFARRVRLPDVVDEDHVKATSADGVLRIELRRSPTAQPRRIPVTTSG